MKISIATVNRCIEAVHNALWFMAYMKVISGDFIPLSLSRPFTIYLSITVNLTKS